MDSKVDNVVINYSSAGNLVSLSINKYYHLESMEIQESMFDVTQKALLEELIVSSINEAINKIADINLKNSNQVSESAEPKKKQDDGKKGDLFDKVDLVRMSEMVDDITKSTSVKYENGNPVLAISLDSTTLDMMQKMSSMMKDAMDKDATDKEDA